MRNHTATHLLQAGLREVLGKHVKQAGSLVAPNHLRFDFSHFTGVAEEELQDIEDIINKEVLRNERVEIIENIPIDVAVNEYHAMALFGEKYGDRVRVIKIGDFSTELCGGTHTGATGEIGLIKILKEGSVSSGVRRIEAVTGEGSLRHFRKDHELESVVASLNSKEAESPADALRAELERRDSEIKRLTRELDQARMKSASSSAASATDKVKEVKGVKVLAHRVDNLERAQLRTLVDQLRDKLGSGVVVVGSATDGNVSLIAGVTKDLTGRIQAGKVVGAVAEKVGGKGGGRPMFRNRRGRTVSVPHPPPGTYRRLLPHSKQSRWPCRAVQSGTRKWMPHGLRYFSTSPHSLRLGMAAAGVFSFSLRPWFTPFFSLLARPWSPGGKDTPPARRSVRRADYSELMQNQHRYPNQAQAGDCPLRRSGLFVLIVVRHPCVAVDQQRGRGPNRNSWRLAREWPAGHLSKG